MARSVKRLSHSLSLKAWLPVIATILAIFIAAPQGWAQHPVSHGVGAGVRVPPPPRTHGTVSTAPVLRAPIYTPRNSVGAAGMVGTVAFRPPRRPIRPFPPVFAIYAYPFPIAGTWWQWDYCWWEGCGFFWTLGYNAMPFYEYAPANEVSVPQYEPPVYGEEREDLPLLYLKDGSVLSVTDYWAVDGQLHFTMIEAEGAKPVEHTIPLEQLDVQKSAAVNTGRGFRFMLRDEPFEQYVRDHPEGPPDPVVVPHD